MDRLIGLFEQYTELLCPLLLAILLTGSLQFAEMVGIAQGVKSAVMEIGFPVIVINPCETGQNPDRFYDLAAPFFMGSEMAQARAGNIVQPAAFAADIDPGLADMKQALLPQCLLDPQLKDTEPVKRILIEIDNGAAADRNTHLLQEMILNPVVGHHLKL